MQRAKIFSFKGSKARKKSSQQDSIRGTQRWRKVSALKRKIDPMCEDPFEHHKNSGNGATATQVHHKISVKECLSTGNPEGIFDLENLMSVCTACHAQLEN